MSAPCSVRKDKSGAFQKIKAIVFSDKITLIVCAAMFALLCIVPMLIVSFDREGGLYYVVGKYNEWNSEMLLFLEGICVIFSFTAGILTTQYLSKRESAEYHNKLPIGMRKILLVKIVSSIIVCICTIIISLAVVYLLSFIFPSRFTPWGNFRATVVLFKALIPYFFMYYALGVLLGTLGGGIYTKVVYFFVIILSISAVVALYETYDIYFFPKHIEFDGAEFYQVIPYSPMLYHGFDSTSYMLKIFDGTFVPMTDVIINMICVSIDLLALSLYLVKYRKTEYAEYSFNSTVSARVFRALAVFATYCIIILKLEDFAFIKCADKPYNTDILIGPAERDIENIIGFNYLSAVILFGIFLIFSYPLKNRKKLLCAYDYLPILLLLIIIENMIFGYWK